jgi:hypothetical protein
MVKQDARAAQRHPKDETVNSEGDSTRITFQPNPSFHEPSYQDRVAHAMAGMLIIHTTDMRSSEIDGHLEHKVE